MIDDLSPFDSPLMLIGAAKKDIVDIKTACDAFIKTRKYAIVEQFDAKTKEKVVKLRFDDGIPGQLRVNFSRVINDLRHALDQATCDGALTLGATSTKNVYFPFGKDLKDFEGKVKDHCRTVRADLRSFIEKFCAYYGGDNLLWSLTRLAAMKHQRIIALSTEANGFIFHSDDSMLIQGPCTIGINKWNDRRNELEFARVQPGGGIQMKLDIPFQVVIGHADVVAGKPVATVLDEYASKVESIVLAIKAETLRLKGV